MASLAAEPSGEAGNAAEANAEENSTGSRAESEIVGEIFRFLSRLNSSATSRRNIRRRIHQRRTYGFSRNLSESYEALRQNIGTLNQLVGSQNRPPVHTNSEMRQPFNTTERKFELGQWLDVQDTIDQWLEAQVIDRNPSQVYVHYNGWGSRWDEWIDNGSHRIAPFRTHTVQSAQSLTLSPSPAQPVDGDSSRIPSHEQDYNLMFEAVGNLLLEAGHEFIRLKQLSDGVDTEADGMSHLRGQSNFGKGHSFETEESKHFEHPSPVNNHRRFPMNMNTEHEDSEYIEAGGNTKEKTSQGPPRVKFVQEKPGAGPGERDAGLRNILDNDAFSNRSFKSLDKDIDTISIRSMKSHFSQNNLNMPHSYITVISSPFLSLVYNLGRGLPGAGRRKRRTRGKSGALPERVHLLFQGGSAGSH